MSDDDGDSSGSFCCGCCVGLAIGWLLFSSSSLIEIKARRVDNSSIERIIDSEKSAYLLNGIDNYQRNISPRIRERLGIDKLCKFEPSCSEYAKQAIQKYGPFDGVLVASRRLLRCNPLSIGSYDPVEDANKYLI